MNIHPSADCTNETTLFGFEGPEKRLEVNFRRLGANDDGLGLRAINKDLWQEMLNFARCTIISVSKTDDFDAYVLSESSLFVFPLKMMIKTCGTTTLLKILPKLLEYAASCNLAVDLVMFSRKNFVFPCKQVFPHDKWDSELEILTEHFGENGHHHILGRPTEDHWYVYVADFSQPGAYDNKSEQIIELMMHNLDTEVMKLFYKKPETDDRAKFPGIADIIPGSETDEFNFTPCGYSMNGLMKDVYSTIHITPEPHCSYVSFETNLATPNYKDLLQYVLNLFKPGTVTLAYYTKGQEEPQFAQNWDIISSELPGFTLSNKTSPEKEGNSYFALANLTATDLEEKKRKAKRAIAANAAANAAALAVAAALPSTSAPETQQIQFDGDQTRSELAQIIHGLSEIRTNDFLVSPSEC